MRVLTVGVFDYFHFGHLRLFERAKEYGNYLIVAVQDSDYILKYKPQARVLYSTNERRHIISALRIVDETVVYYDVDEIVKQVDFDVFVIGEDQNHAGFERAVVWCKNNGKTVVRLERTAGISSSNIKENLGK